MKNIFTSAFRVFIYIFIFLPIYGTPQNKPDWLRTVDYIPTHTGISGWWFEHTPAKAEIIVNSMKTAGIDALSLDVKDPGYQMNLLDTKGLKVLPVMAKDPNSSNLFNYIQYYTDGKYSEWEAEGTPQEKGDATLYHDTRTSIISGSPSYVKLNPSSASESFEMINGPYYTQEGKYYAPGLNGTIDTLRYTIVYRLKLEHSPNYPNYNGNPSLPICRLQVTYSNHKSTTELGCTYATLDKELKLSDFTLNQFNDYSYDYDLLQEPCPGGTVIDPPQQCSFPSVLNTEGVVPGPRFGRDYVQYKVIWLGNPQYLLSVDKITVSDVRGRRLLNGLSGAKEDIIAQAKSLENNHNELVTGWLGVDEPNSIDCFEPIRIVQHILDSVSNNTRPLWLAWMGHWSGTWENPGNQFGAMKLSPWNEFKKRVGKANIWQDIYYMDYPYNSTSTGPTPDWRVNNIDVACINYTEAHNLDPYYGISLQCGEVHHSQGEQRNINPHELLYETNLALLHGAKFLSFW